MNYEIAGIASSALGLVLTFIALDLHDPVVVVWLNSSATVLLGFALFCWWRWMKS